MEIEIARNNWGNAPIANIKAVLTNCASHLNNLMDDPVADHIIVKATHGENAKPITKYRNFPEDPIIIKLTARDTHWAQYAYQFAHEFCHVLSRYEQLKNNPNKWFHEVLCELASVFTIRRMAEHWIEQPPDPSWTAFARSLDNYAKDLLFNEDRRLPEGATLATWLPAHELALRQNPRLRDQNAIVAYNLLPLFETEPNGWNAIRSLPNTTGMFADYLTDWCSQVQPRDRPFVNCVRAAFR